MRAYGAHTRPFVHDFVTKTMIEHQTIRFYWKLGIPFSITFLKSHNSFHITHKKVSVYQHH